jgi:hypothetical protein
MKTVLRQVNNNQCESDSAHYSDSDGEEFSAAGLSLGPTITVPSIKGIIGVDDSAVVPSRISEEGK